VRSTERRKVVTSTGRRVFRLEFSPSWEPVGRKGSFLLGPDRLRFWNGMQITSSRTSWTPINQEIRMALLGPILAQAGRPGLRLARRRRGSHRQDGPSDEKQMAASATVKARSIANLKLKTLHLRSLKETDKLLHSKKLQKVIKKILCCGPLLLIYHYTTLQI
jgi:hypothetical protein